MDLALEDFRQYIFRASFIDASASYVLALRFRSLVAMFATAFVTPIIGSMVKSDFTTWQFTLNNSHFRYGLFVDELMNFIITIVIIYFVFIVPTRALRRRTGMAEIDKEE